LKENKIGMFDLRNMKIESEVSEFEISQSKEKIDLNKLNIDCSITDFERKTSIKNNHVLKKNTTSLENMDLITFAQMTSGKNQISPLESPKNLISSPSLISPMNEISPINPLPNMFDFFKSGSVESQRRMSGMSAKKEAPLNLSLIKEVVEISNLPDPITHSKTNPPHYLDGATKGKNEIFF